MLRYVRDVVYAFQVFDHVAGLKHIFLTQRDRSSSRARDEIRPNFREWDRIVWISLRVIHSLREALSRRVLISTSQGLTVIGHLSKSSLTFGFTLRARLITSTRRMASSEKSSKKTRPWMIAAATV